MWLGSTKRSLFRESVVFSKGSPPLLAQLWAIIGAQGLSGAATVAGGLHGPRRVTDREQFRAESTDRGCDADAMTFGPEV